MSQPREVAVAIFVCAGLPVIFAATRLESYAPADESPGSAGISPVVAISATSLQATYMKPQDFASSEPFRHAMPIGVLGGSIYLSQVPSDGSAQPSLSP